MSLDTGSQPHSSSNDNDDNPDDYDDVLGVGKSPPHGGECDDTVNQQFKNKTNELILNV